MSTYGLISYAGKIFTESDCHIKHNKKDIAIQCLLLQFFEETIDYFNSLKTFPAREIGDYLHDCCAITIDICKEWNKIKRYQIEDILPSDEVIQKYMSYLDGKKVDKSILNEIIQYEKRLQRKSQNDENLRLIYHEFRNKSPASKIGHFPPFPLDKIYNHIVCKLRFELETKIKSLATALVTRLGEVDNTSGHIETKAQKDDSLDAFLRDRKFFKLVAPIGKNFDNGYTILSNFHLYT